MDLIKATSEVERVIERLSGDLAVDKQHSKYSPTLLQLSCSTYSDDMAAPVPPEQPAI